MKKVNDKVTSMLNESDDLKLKSDDLLAEDFVSAIDSHIYHVEAGISGTETKSLISKIKEAILKILGNDQKLSVEQKEYLFNTLEKRFHKNMRRHKNVEWRTVYKRLQEAPSKKLWSLNEMERTGGRPDVVEYNREIACVVFYDCSKESPRGRRNCVFNPHAEKWMEKMHPEEVFNGNAIDQAKQMGVEIMDKDQYFFLQSLGKFDRNSCSWLDGKDVSREGLGLFGWGDEERYGCSEEPHFIHGIDGGWRGVLLI
jgi:hypothetical protein